MWTEYETTRDGKPVIHHWLRKGKNRIHQIITDFEPYFYVDADADDSAIINDMDRVARIEKCQIKSIFDRGVKKIVTKLPRDVPVLRDKYWRHFEADILFPIRFLIDRKPDFGDYPVVLYIDIEVDDSKGFPDAMEAQRQVVCITCYDSLSKQFYTFALANIASVWKGERINRVTDKYDPHNIFRYTDEKKMLSDFVDFFKSANPDLITGWNVYKFDMTYLVNRMKNLEINVEKLSPIGRITYPKETLDKRGKKQIENLDIAGRMIFDMYTSYRRVHISGLRGNKLEEVAQEELGIGKIVKDKRIYQMTSEEVINYNTGDVELTVEIDKKVGIIKFFWDLANFIGCPINYTLQNSRMADIWILRHASGKVALPSKRHSDSETFEGATVLDPVPGVYKNVAVLDLSKMYPSIIISCNMSPECLDNKGEIDLKNGVRLRRTPGFLPKVLLGLFELRDNYKGKKNQSEFGTYEYKLYKNMEQFVKDLTNSVYGVLAYPGFRLHMTLIAESIPYMGRKTLDFSKSFVEKMGYKVLYGDTDSLMVQIDGDDYKTIIQKAIEIQNGLNKGYGEFAKQFGIIDHKFSVKYEKLYGSVVLYKKKKYAGWLVNQDGRDINDFEVKGFESKRSDNANFTRGFQLEMLKLIASGKNQDELNAFINETIDKMKLAKLDDIGIPKQFHKPLTSYKQSSPHVKGAIYSNTFLGTNYGSGDKPKMVYVFSVKGKPRPKDHCVVFDGTMNIDELVKVDYEKMAEVLIHKKVRNLYEEIGWNYVPRDNLLKWL